MELKTDYKEIKLNGNFFEYNGKKYSCEYAIKRDIVMITQEAECNHKNEFENLYVGDSIKPYEIRLYTNEKDIPIFGMIVYFVPFTEEYKKECWGDGRSACGGYYPIKEYGQFAGLRPHSYQESICW